MPITPKSSRAPIPALALLLIAAALPPLLAGCSDKSKQSEEPVAQDPLYQEQLRRDLNIVGPWSQTLDGRRCRIMLADDSAPEARTVLAALLVQNTADKELDFVPDLTWHISNSLLPAESDTPLPPTIRLAPNETYIVGPIRLRLPPFATQSAIAASLAAAPSKDATPTRALVAPPVPFTITPGLWGDPVAGLRLALTTPRPFAWRNQPLPLELCLHNTAPNPTLLAPIDWSTAAVEILPDKHIISVYVRPAPTAPQPLAPGQMSILTSPPILNVEKPGKYRLRVVYRAEEAPTPAWHSSAASNEVDIDVY